MQENKDIFSSCGYVRGYEMWVHDAETSVRGSGHRSW